MERTDVIWLLCRQKKHFEEELEKASEPALIAILQQCREVCDQSIAALQEQEHKGNGCSWCWHFQCDPQHLISEGNGRYRELIYQFCPICGRKLEEFNYAA